MPSRHRLLLAAATLAALLLVVGYYSFHEVASAPVSNVSLKIANAKERMQQNLEEQNKDLKKALAAAKASIKQVVAETPAATSTSPEPEVNQETTIDKHGFAYVFYATTDAYACSVLVNIDRLKNLLHTTLAIHVLASPDVSEDYLQAIRGAGAILHIQSPPPMPEGATHYYKDSLLKLRAFGMHKFSPGLTRVLVLDSDQLILKNLDHLFSDLPIVDLAAPRAYWLSKDFLASTFMLIFLSDRLWSFMDKAMQLNLQIGAAGEMRYDMDLVNAVLGDTVMMLSGEYICLNSHWEDWNLPRWYHAERALNWTTIKVINDLSKPPPSVYQDTSLGSKEKRQIFKHTDLPPEPVAVIPPTPTLSLPASLPQELFTLSTDPAPAPKIPPHPAYPELADPILPPLDDVVPSPRFPLAHPLALELEDLYNSSAAVLHFSAVGKPWTFTPDNVLSVKPDAHPLLAEQFKTWRDAAEEVCPGGVQRAMEGNAEMPKSMQVIMPAENPSSTMATATAPTTAGFGEPVVLVQTIAVTA